MKRQTEISFETEEVLLFKSRRNFEMFCGPCNAMTQMLPVDAAAMLYCISEREIFRLIEGGFLHFVEAERVFVCLASLANALRQPGETATGQLPELPAGEQANTIQLEDKKMRKITFMRSMFLILCGFCCVFAAQAQTAVFTYQGKLTDTNLAANGTYLMQFRVYDAVSGGTAFGSGITCTVSVTNGIYTVPLDFSYDLGTGIFSGSDRFLEIAVKRNAIDPYTVLSPRQQITSAPYAFQASNAALSFNSLDSNKLGGVAANQYVVTTDSRMSDARAPTAGSANYIQNTTNQQSTSNFNISGDGTAGGTLSGNIVNVTTQYNLGGTRLLSSDANSNVFVGQSTGVGTTQQTDNTFVGSGFSNGSGDTNHIANGNTFIGSIAGFGNTNGHDNSFVGSAAGYTNSSGNFNSFFGTQAGKLNSTQHDNTFIGYQAGFTNGFLDNSNLANFNTFAGSNAGLANTKASNNSFFGYNSGLANTLGGFNSFFGSNAGAANTTAINNSYFGQAAGYNSTGGNNTFLGNGAGLNNVAGSNNTAIGDLANFSVNNLDHATAIGADSSVSTSNTIALGRSDGSDKVVIYGLGSPGSTSLCLNSLSQIASCTPGNIAQKGVETATLDAIHQQKDQIDLQQKQMAQQQATIDALKKLVCAQNPQATVCKEEK